MVKISKRLRMVAENVRFGGTVADIGCDHGFTSIYLLQTGKADHMIAMDINQGPLDRAEMHRDEQHLQDQMELRLSDGLDALLEREADALLISGMGGALMARILQDGKNIVAGCRELILSPQSEIYLVRQKLHQLKFRIDHEEMLVDQGKFYVIIHAVPGTEQYTSMEYVYGKYLIEHKDAVFAQYIRKEKQRVEKIVGNFSEKIRSEKAQQQYNALQKERNELTEILSELDRKE